MHIPRLGFAIFFPERDFLQDICKRRCIRFEFFDLVFFSQFCDRFVDLRQQTLWITLRNCYADLCGGAEFVKSQCD